MLAGEGTVPRFEDFPDQASPAGSASDARYDVTDWSFWPGSPCNRLTPRLQWHDLATV